ncbi:MAG TPA: phosphatase PAP2 family protein [Fimbriimonadaceae bacterium]|jgi:membrane-associated phospholipid phosphatase
MNGLWDFDQTLFKDINVGWHSPFLDPIFFLFTCTGVSWILILICLALFPWKAFLAPKKGSFGQRIRNNPDKTIPLSVSAIIGLATSGLIDDLIKYAVPRERPSNLSWSIPEEKIYAHSFASGHTATAFGAAFMIFFLTRGSRKSPLGWAALVWATGVGVSRMYLGVHWPTDVLSGFLTALMCTSALMLVLPSYFRQKHLATERAPQKTVPLS